MGLNSEPGFPHKGWVWQGVEDSALHCSSEDYPSCVFCDQRKIRYVHRLEHPAYPEPIDVGCVCAEILTKDYVNPQVHEKRLRSVAARRDKFPDSKRWEKGTTGLEWITLDMTRIGVFPVKGGGYKIKLDNRWGRLVFPDLREAKLRAFDVVQHRNEKRQK